MVPQKRHQNKPLKLVTTWIYIKTLSYTRKMHPKRSTISCSPGWDGGPKNREEKGWRLRVIFLQECIAQVAERATKFVSASLFCVSVFGCKANWYSFSCAKHCASSRFDQIWPPKVSLKQVPQTRSSGPIMRLRNSMLSSWVLIKEQNISRRFKYAR